MDAVVRGLVRLSQHDVGIIDVGEAEKVIWPEGAPRYEDQAESFCEWLNEHNVLYYARPKETFCVSEAVQEALNEGCCAVVLENMS